MVVNGRGWGIKGIRGRVLDGMRYFGGCLGEGSVGVSAVVGVSWR